MPAAGLLSTCRLVLGICACASTAAIARAETEPIRIDYRAPAGCPTPEQFVSDVLARADRARIATNEQAARTFVVVISREGARFVGSLAVREPGDAARTSGETVARKVTSARCGEVAEALVLSTALAVDPTPTPSPAPTESPNAEPARPRAAEAAPIPGQPRATSRRAPDGARGARRRTEQPNRADDEYRDEYEFEYEPDESEGGVSARASSWSTWILLGPALRTGIAPDAAFGGSLGFEVRLTSSPALGEAQGSAAELATVGADVVFLRGPLANVEGASSSFGFLLLRPRTCAVVARVSQALSFGPCLSGELGAVLASGSDLPRPETERRFWGAVAATLRADARLSPRWLLEIEGGVALALTRYRFVFSQPETSIYGVPAFGLTLGARLGAQPF